MGIFDIFKRKQMDMQTTQPVQSNNVSNIEQQPIQNSTPVNVNGDFVMEIEDVFYISGRGTVATGRVLKGRVDVNDVVQISELGISTTVAGVEQFRKSLGYAQEGDTAGLLLSEISRDQISRGMHLVK